jgi:hypothetical protein
MTEAVVSEKFSEKPRRPRGRPPIWPADQLQALALVAQGRVGTRRGLNNACFGIRALTLLKRTDPDAFDWLFSETRRRAGQPKARRLTILEELGRIRNPRTLVYCATELCCYKPTTAAAVTYLRDVRRRERAEQVKQS